MSDDPPEERSLDQGPRPHGLAGLLIWPLQALLLGAIRLAAGLIEGLVRALIPGAQGPDAPKDSAEHDPEDR